MSEIRSCAYRNCETFAVGTLAVGQLRVWLCAEHAAAVGNGQPLVASPTVPPDHPSRVEAADQRVLSINCPAYDCGAEAGEPCYERTIHASDGAYSADMVCLARIRAAEEARASLKSRPCIHGLHTCAQCRFSGLLVEAPAEAAPDYAGRGDALVRQWAEAVQVTPLAGHHGRLVAAGDALSALVKEHCTDSPARHSWADGR